jgi:hypothetical protein
MAYQALELGQAGNPACPNEADEASTLICPRSNRLLIQVSKQAVFVQLGTMDQGITAGAGGVQWQTPKPLLPLTASLSRVFDAVRVWNYTPGAEAQVFVTVDSV